MYVRSSYKRGGSCRYIAVLGYRSPAGYIALGIQALIIINNMIIIIKMLIEITTKKEMQKGEAHKRKKPVTNMAFRVTDFRMLQKPVI